MADLTTFRHPAWRPVPLLLLLAGDIWTRFAFTTSTLLGAMRGIKVPMSGSRLIVIAVSRRGQTYTALQQAIITNKVTTPLWRPFPVGQISASPQHIVKGSKYA